MTLDEFLVDSGWTKSEIAKKSGISEAAVSQWKEIPKLRLETLMILLGRTPKSDFVKDAEQMQEDGIPDLVADGKLTDYVEPEISYDGLIRSIDATPIEERKVVHRGWKLKDQKVYWQRKWWGRGSKYDFQYSAAQLKKWGKSLKRVSNQELMENAQARRDNVSGLIPGFDCTPEQNNAQMMDIFSAIRKNEICPVVVDEIESRWVNGHPIAFRVNPWERLL